MSNGESMASVKRPANSPPVDNSEGKRPCTEMDSSFVSAAGDDTIITVTTPFLQSTLLDSPEVQKAASPLREELRAVLQDPEVIRLISAAVSASLKEEVAGLRKQLEERDRTITVLRDQVDELEQYSRRNCIRVSSVPENSTEDTDAIVHKIAESVGVELPDGAIDRSHRIGRKPTGPSTTGRPIIVKFTSYRHKQALMKAKRELGKVDTVRLFPDPSWPALPRPASPSSSAAATKTGTRIFLNDDLTKIRSLVAAKARQLKRQGKVDDTWVRDGLVYVRRGDTRTIFTTLRDMDALEAKLT